MTNQIMTPESGIMFRRHPKHSLLRLLFFHKPLSTRFARFFLILFLLGTLRLPTFFYAPQHLGACSQTKLLFFTIVRNLYK